MNPKICNALTLKKNKKRWRENIRKNIRYIKKSYKGNVDLCDKDKVLIIGAGPSTDIMNLWPLIRENRSKFKVFAVDMALHPCLYHGITPDMIVTSDASPLVIEMLKSGERIDTMFSIFSPPEVVEACNGRRSFYLPENMTEHLEDDTKDIVTRHVPVTYAMGNVGGTALVLAELLFRAMEIGLVGMDYGFIRVDDGDKKVFQKYALHTMHRGPGHKLEGRPIPYSNRNNPTWIPHGPVRFSGMDWMSDNVYMLYAQQTYIYLTEFTHNILQAHQHWEPSDIYTLTPGLLNGFVGKSRLKRSTVRRFLRQ